MDPARSKEIWDRLSSGAPLDGLDLPIINGRVDLRGFVAPKAEVERRFAVASNNVTELSNVPAVRGGQWRKLDLSRSQLPSLRFHDSLIEDCRFEGALCTGWRCWGTTVAHSSFASADLRSSALGGIEGGKLNLFLDVDFTRADLRRTAYVAARLVGCRFDRTKLTKVDFNGAIFEDCVFEGELREVQFHRHAFRGETLPPNAMRGVDFRKAKLRYVEFRGLDMDHVRWPEGPDHFVIQDFPAVLDKLLGVWGGREDVRSRRLAATFGVVKKWLGAGQRVGVLSKADLIETGGEEAVADVLGMVASRT